MRLSRFLIPCLFPLALVACASSAEVVTLRFPGAIEVSAAPHRGAAPARPREAELPPAPAPVPPPAPAPAPVAPDPPAPVPVAPPKVEVSASELTISEKIQFASNAARILPTSAALIDAIAATLKANPHIKKVLVEGHASTDGTTDRNTRLSADRAKAVVAALVSRGVRSSLLTAVGVGATKPIADDSTDAGREQNRRVEFHILKQDSRTEDR